MTKTAEPALAVEIRVVEAQPYLAKHVHASIGTVGKSVQEGFAALYHRLEETNSRATAPPFLIADFPKDGCLELELGAPCASPPPAGAGFLPRSLPGGRVAVTVHHGSYDRIGEVYRRLSEWISAQGLTMAEAPREVYLTPPGEEPITEVVWPIR
jgi:hypothetical protein